MLTKITYWDQLEALSCERGVKAERVCRVAKIAPSTLKDLRRKGTVPQKKTRERIEHALVTMGIF